MNGYIPAQLPAQSWDLRTWLQTRWSDGPSPLGTRLVQPVYHPQGNSRIRPRRASCSGASRRPSLLRSSPRRHTRCRSSLRPSSRWAFVPPASARRARCLLRPRLTGFVPGAGSSGVWERSGFPCRAAHFSRVAQSPIRDSANSGFPCREPAVDPPLPLLCWRPARHARSPSGGRGWPFLPPVFRRRPRFSRPRRRRAPLAVSSTGARGSGA